ncbi:integral membrane protein [Rutstroemia sp. NJR-2017a BBW]|nr:integral membrane protein [Rutstroemia sp. NJR-2017a BBW]
MAVIPRDNPDEDVDDTTSTTAVGALVIVLAVVFVALRFYARYSTKTGFGWDDWLILLALVATILTDVLVLWSTSVNPNGPAIASNTDPTYEYTPADVFYTKLNFVATVLYFTITAATKLSILFMYNRLFSISKTFRYQVIAAGALVLIFWVGCTVANLLNCRPLEWTWRNSRADPRYCFNYNIFWMASGVVEAFLDVLIIVIPVRLIFGLHLTLARKIALTAVFLLGIFVIVTGIVKVVLSYAPGSREPSFNKTEIWTTVHCGIGMVCACLPVCWPVIARLAQLRFSRIQESWHRVSIWLSGEKSSHFRSTNTYDLERATSVNTGDIPLMDDPRDLGNPSVERFSPVELPTKSYVRVRSDSDGYGG